MQRVASVRLYLFGSQRAEVGAGEQRGESGDVEHGGAEHRARGVERVVVDGLEFSARATFLEQRPAQTEQLLGACKKTVCVVRLRLRSVTQDQAGQRGAL